MDKLKKEKFEVYYTDNEGVEVKTEFEGTKSEAIRHSFALQKTGAKDVVVACEHYAMNERFLAALRNKQ